MIRNLLKKIISKLPQRFQQEMKRLYFAHQIRNRRFRTDEKEYDHLKEWVQEGDWVLDIGANIGHYTAKLAELVGSTGRVIAFEPVPDTFELLAANMSSAGYKNVTLLNVAVSDRTQILGIDMPKFDTGLDNYYRAHLTQDSASLNVLCLSVADLKLRDCIKLVKIDAEGHDLTVLKGMQELLERDHPVLIVEDDSADVLTFLEGIGYNN